MPPSSIILSRRTLIGAAAYAPTAAAPSDQTTALCRDWLADEAEIDRLLPLWGDLEDRDAPRATLDARLKTLCRRRDALAERLPDLAARDLAAVAGKLAVAARLIPPEDHPTAHRLLARLADEVAALVRLTGETTRR
ncbi:MAG: hypothetical protein WC068_15675 [Caulobacter sp.]